MNASPEKAPKKVKEKRQTPEERQEALRYNHMMYGPTAGELRPVAKKTNLGIAYLKHPKFQSLITAFRKGTAFQFDVTDKGKVFTISTDGSQISFDGKTIYYSRPLNKHEDNLLLDRAATIQYQGIDALVHLAVAVLRALPELGSPQLSYMDQQFYYGIETLESGIADQGPNLLVGSFKHSKVVEKARK
jgi:predicted ester cyclase